MEFEKGPDMGLMELANRFVKQSAVNLGSVDDESFVDLGYRLILGRMPDDQGRKHFLGKLQANSITRSHFIDTLIDSSEFAEKRLHNNMGTSLHESRQRFIHQLPPANRIVDLGGSSADSDHGAMVNMGYPYTFERLTIVDLPNEDRHALYKNKETYHSVQTSKGLVDYLYQSMADLGPIPDASVDLVYSGQSIEHVTREDAVKVYAEVRRVLKDTGHFCLDTPNGRMTRIQQDAFIDPDHKHEYTHEELSADLRKAGFRILEAKGLNYAGRITDRSQFSELFIARNCGLFAEIQNCYLLAYVCAKV